MTCLLVICALFLCATAQVAVLPAPNGVRLSVIKEAGTPAGLSNTAGQYERIIFSIEYASPVSLVCNENSEDYCITMPVSCKDTKNRVFKIDPDGMAYYEPLAQNLISDDLTVPGATTKTIVLSVYVLGSELDCTLTLAAGAQLTLSAGSTFNGARTLPAGDKSIKVNTITPTILDVYPLISQALLQEPFISTDNANAKPYSFIIRCEFDSQLSVRAIGTQKPTLKVNTNAKLDYLGLQDQTFTTTSGLRTITYMEFLYTLKEGDTTFGEYLDVSGEDALDIYGFDFHGTQSQVPANFTLPLGRLKEWGINFTSTKFVIPPRGYEMDNSPTTTAKPKKRGVEQSQVQAPASLVDVSALIQVSSFFGINEREQVLQADLTIVFSWQDPRFIVPANLDGGNGVGNSTGLIYLANGLGIWQPDVIIWNLRSARQAPLFSRFWVTNGTVYRAERYILPLELIVKAQDFPFDTQLFDIQIRPGISAAGDAVNFVPRETDAEEEELVQRINNPNYIFYNKQQYTEISNDQVYVNQILHTTILAARRSTLSALIVVIALTCVMLIAYFTFYLPFKSDGRVTVCISMIVASMAFSVTIQALLPPVSYMTRMVLYFILVVIFVSLCLIPQVCIRGIFDLCEDLRKDVSDLDKKKEKAEKEKEKLDKEYKEACKTAKEAGEAKPAPPNFPDTRDYTVNLSANFAWFFVITPRNLDKYYARLIVMNHIFRVTHILLLVCFFLIVFLTPSSIPAQLTGDLGWIEPGYIESLPTVTYRSAFALGIVGVFLGGLGLIVIVLVLLWLFFSTKEEKAVHAAGGEMSDDSFGSLNYFRMDDLEKVQKV